MERDKKNFIPDIITIVLLIIGLCILTFSNNLILNITVALIFILYSVISNINIKKKKDNILKEIQESNQTYMVYKESYKSNILISLMLTITSLVNLDTIYRNSDAFIKDSYTLHSIFSFIKNISVHEASRSVVFILLLVVCILNFIKFRNSTAVVSDDIIIFHDGSIIEISEIVSLKYIHQYFRSNKYKILEIRTKNYLHKIIVDLKDSDRLKDYLNSKIVKNIED